MSYRDWISARTREFIDLRGHQIQSWAGMEMAFREAGPDGGAQFVDAAAPCLQLWVLEMSLRDGRSVGVITYQGDEWGLCTGEVFVGDEGVNGIFRRRLLDELLVGRIDDVSVFTDTDSGDIAEVVVTVAGWPLLLMAGEIDEDTDGSLRFSRMDESVLVFADPTTPDRIDWSPRRDSRALRLRTR